MRAGLRAPARGAAVARLAAVAAVSSAIAALAVAAPACRCGTGTGGASDSTAGGADPALLAEIGALELARAPAEPRLAELARAPHPVVRHRAVLALGRLRRADAVPALLYALADLEPSVRASAAFGLGLLGPLAGAEVEAVLQARWAAETPDAADSLAGAETAAGKREVRLAVLEALGRVGTAAMSLSLLGGALVDTDPRVRARAGVAIGVYAYRGNRADRETIARLLAAVRDGDRDVRFGAVYALMRLKDASAAPALASSMADVDPEVRATAARALGDFLATGAPEEPAVLEALQAGVSDGDWRVRVEVLRALGKGSGTAAGAAYDEALAVTWNNVSSSHMELVGPKLQAVLAALEAGERFFAPATRGRWTPPAVAQVLELSDLTDAVIDYQVKELLSIDLVNCRAAFLHDLGAGKADRVARCGSKGYPAWRRLALEAKLLGTLASPAQKPSPESLLASLERLKALAVHVDARVRTAAVEAAGGIDLVAARVFVRERLADADVAVLSAAADAIASAAKDSKIDAMAVPALLSAYARLDSASDFEAQVGILGALGALKPGTAEAHALFAAAAADPNTAVREAALAAYEAATGKKLAPVSAAPAPAPTPVPAPGGPGTSAPLDPRTYPPVKPGTTAVLKTTKGEVKIELLPEAAPATAANFLGLARAKFYDGNVVHRVVPNFVVQMGCPRGDGWGGPGYWIADEISPLPFVRGAVGMALAGKDTAGSQFFIMHAWHPHLDGRFTVFARVVEGLDVADMLEIGDVISGIDIHEPGAPPPAP